MLISSLFVFLTYAAPASSAGAAGTTVLHCDEMLDVKSGKVVQHVNIEVQDRKITKVELATRAPKGATHLKDQLCMPGWIDTHMHFEQQLPEGMNTMDQPDEARQVLDSAEFPRRNLLAGFTTVRDLGSARNVAVEFRNAIQTGKMIGPRVLATRSPISAPSGHGDFLNSKKMPMWDEGKRKTYMEYYGIVFINDASDIDKWFKITFDERPQWEKKFPRIVKDDRMPDAVKVMATGGVVSPEEDSYKRQLSDKLIGHAVELAKEYSAKIGRPLPVAAHAHGIDGILDAARAGVDSIEHATELGGPIRDDLSDTERKRYEAAREEAIRLIREKNIRVIPTIEAADSVVGLANAGKLPPIIRDKAIRVGGKMLKNFANVVALDLPMAFGTDTGVSNHGENWREFILLVENGHMKPVRAFQLATIEAAKMLRRDSDFGTVAVGQSADIIALPRGVIADIHLVNQVKFVMKEGVVYKKDGKALF